MTAEEMAHFRAIEKAANDSQAVGVVAREFLCRSRLQEIKHASGEVDFVNNWRLLETGKSCQPLPRN